MENIYCQGYLSDGNIKDEKIICNWSLKHMNEVEPTNQLWNIVMFDWASNVQLVGIVLKVHYPQLTVICRVEHTV